MHFWEGIEGRMHVWEGRTAKKRRKLTPSGLHFGRLFRPCWPPRAIKRPLKKHTKFWLIWKSIFHRFFIDFGRVLGGSWSQDGFQNPLKIGSTCWPNFYLNFDRSGYAFYWILPRSWKAQGAKSIEKTIVWKHFCYFGQLANKRPYDRFFSQLGSQLGTQNPPKIHPRGSQNQ